jgi:hypothetical protein
MLEEKIQDLIETIKRAFVGVEHPGRSLGNLEELHYLVDKGWEDMSLKDIVASEGLGFFSRKGLHYFLPAYLIAILKHPDQLDAAVREQIMFHFAHYDTLRGVPPAWWTAPSEKLYERFTQEQKQVIIEFLEWYDIQFPSWTEEFINSFSEYEKKVYNSFKFPRHKVTRTALDYWKECLYK